jgi:thioredoxin reductase (NADPH)
MHDLIIIGAGPAGLTAALYAGRFKLDTLVLEKFVVGGQILLTPSIENYPGFPGGIASDKLIDAMKQQVDELGVKIVEAEALDITVERGQHHAYTVITREEAFKTKCIIVAAGARWKKLGVPGEEQLIGKGVSYCATCDGPLFRNKAVVVVGGGDKAIEEALFLTAYASKVTLVHRRQEFRAAQILLDKARGNPKIEFVLDATVEEIKGPAGFVESVTIRDLKTNAQRAHACQGVFIFIGISPNSDFIKKKVETDENGFIITDDSMKTSLHGVFACGDCRKKSLYQVVTGCGEAAVACHSAHTYLLNR